MALPLDVPFFEGNLEAYLPACCLTNRANPVAGFLLFLLLFLQEVTLVPFFVRYCTAKHDFRLEQVAGRVLYFLQSACFDFFGMLVFMLYNKKNSTRCNTRVRGYPEVTRVNSKSLQICPSCMHPLRWRAELSIEKPSSS